MNVSTATPGRGEREAAAQRAPGRLLEIVSTPFEIDLGAGCLRKHGEPVPLRPKTWELLLYLVKHAGELVTKDDILNRVWAGAAVVEEIISTSVSELRRAFDDTHNDSHY